MIKRISPLLLVLCCTACGTPGGSNTDQTVESKSEQEVSSKLSRIESAFQRGDTKTACQLQISLSKDLANYQSISPKLLKELKSVQVKCGARGLSLDF